MNTKDVIDARRDDCAGHAGDRYWSTTAARVAVNDASLSPRGALTQLKNVQQALSSTQHELIAARRQIAHLKESNARLRAIADRFGTNSRLPKHALLLDRLNQALVRVKRQQKQLALFMLDVDQVKNINDRLSFPASDNILQRVAKRLLSCERDRDWANLCGEDESPPVRPGADDANDAFDTDRSGGAYRSANPSDADGPPLAAAAGIGDVRHDVGRDPVPSSSWARTDFCLSAGLGPEVGPHIEQILASRLRFRKGDLLYRVGDGFNALYAIRAGTCKTVLLARDGHDQIAGYHIVGDIIGIDGVGTDIHECQATALEDMDVCPLPFEQLENLARLSDPFRHNLHKLLSQESARAHALMLVLGTMRAEQRLAVFLLDLSQRYRARGYSSCEFVLRMTREEIGSYLGLKLETVSRLFSRFQRDGLIQVQGRAVKLLDRVALSRLAGCET